ncbi:hypothetical protein DF047_10550 [Burkholderia cenocepacia]|uniref:HAD domain-containing protein n=1 Tax=Burkholderia cenocepacia TaxID=95486 RepID=UPI000F5C0504|nr:HAD domain-containing protein [Burkholderia cenocepacia]RQV10020.1 hypothetical protein DF047_10550 [Burkholderia cenocepacia]
MLIYLNFDGVLHPNHLQYRYRHSPELLWPSHTAFEYAPALENAFEDCPDATVVLNTWWTYYLTVEACLQLLPASIRPRVVGTTLVGGIREEPLPNRVREAERHIGVPTNELLVLDNSSARYGESLLPQLLLVNEETGLSCPSAMRALKKRLHSQWSRVASHKIDQRPVPIPSIQNGREIPVRQWTETPPADHREA